MGEYASSCECGHETISPASIRATCEACGEKGMCRECEEHGEDCRC